MANKAILLGWLGSDPELAQTTGGKTVAKFSLATRETYKGKTTTQWHKIIAWQKLAEICTQYLTKGQQVYVEGKIVYREWEKDNKKHYATEIHIEKMEFVGSKGEKQTTEAEGYNDIPF
jgi:single-strand DNA-binding protein